MAPRKRGEKANSDPLINTCVTGLPDLSFLELSSRRAPRSQVNNQASNNHEGVGPEDIPISSTPAQNSSSTATAQNNGPTPLSLLCPTSKNKNNITQLEALQDAKAWFDGAVKNLQDRLALAEETTNGLSELLTSLRHCQTLQARSQVTGEDLSVPDGPQYDYSYNDPRMWPFQDPMPGVPVDTPGDEAAGRITRFNGIVMRNVNRLPAWTMHPAAVSGVSEEFQSAIREVESTSGTREQQRLVRDLRPRPRATSAPATEIQHFQVGTIEVGVTEADRMVAATASECGGERHHFRSGVTSELPGEQEEEWVGGEEDGREDTTEQELAAAEEVAAAWIARVRVLRAKWNAGVSRVEANVRGRG